MITIYKNSNRSLPIIKGLIWLMIMAFPLIVFGQQIRISGKVVNADSGDGLTGVTILEKGTQNGVLTDDNGNFSIVTQQPAILVASMVGMNAQEIEVEETGIITISMEEKQVSLEEVVMVGYGTRKKKDLTGSISQISSERLGKRDLKAVGEALQGEIAGIQVTTPSVLASRLLFAFVDTELLGITAP